MNMATRATESLRAESACLMATSGTRVCCGYFFTVTITRPGVLSDSKAKSKAAYPRVWYDHANPPLPK